MVKKETKTKFTESSAFKMWFVWKKISTFSLRLKISYIFHLDFAYFSGLHIPGKSERMIMYVIRRNLYLIPGETKNPNSESLSLFSALYRN